MATASPHAVEETHPTVTSGAPAATPRQTDPHEIDISQVASLGLGQMTPINYSSNGKYSVFAVGATMYLYDSASNQEVGSIETPWSGIGEFTFSPDGELVAAVSSPFGSFVIVDLGRQKIVAEVAPLEYTSVTFTQDNHYAAYVEGHWDTGGFYSYIDLWNIAENRQEHSFPTASSNIPGSHEEMSAPAISPDGKLVAAGSTDTRVYVWGLHNGQIVSVLEGHTDRVTSVDFSPDGRLLASGSPDGTVRLWNAVTGELKQTIVVFEDLFVGVKFSQDGKRLKISFAYRTDLAWDFAEGRLLPVESPPPTQDPLALQLHRQGYSEGLPYYDSNQVVFSPDGRMIAIASQHVLVWDVATGHLLQSLEGLGHEFVSGLTFSPDGRRVAAVTFHGGVAVWDVQMGQALFRLDPASSAATDGIGVGVLERQAIAFSPDGERLAYGNGDRVEIWDIQSVKLRATLELHGAGSPTSVAFSSDGGRLYVALNVNQAVEIWDMMTGQLIRKIDLPPTDPHAFSETELHPPFLARNNYQYDAGRFWIELWNLDTEQYQMLTTASQSTQPIHLSPDGRMLVAACEGRLYFWKVSTGELAYISSQTIQLAGMAISPDNKTLGLGYEGKVELWDIGRIAELMDRPITATAVVPTPWFQSSE